METKFKIDNYNGFVPSLKVGDLVNISTKEKPYKILSIKDGGNEPRFGPLWVLSLEENETGNNKHDDVVGPDGKSLQYYRNLSPYNTGVMKTLNEYNKDRRAEIKTAEQIPQKAGVLCECGAELVYSDNCVLTSMPPQRNVHCPSCGFSGYKVV